MPPTPIPRLRLQRHSPERTGQSARGLHTACDARTAALASLSAGSWLPKRKSNPSRPPSSNQRPARQRRRRPASSQRRPSGESFTIETASGSIDTVEASPSTTYTRAEARARRKRALRPSPTSPPATTVGVAGTLTGSTFTATAVVISSPQAGGHPDLITSFTLEEPGDPEAAQNVIFNAPRESSATPTRSPSAPRCRIRPRSMPAQLPGRPDHRPRQLRRQTEQPARHRADLSTSNPSRPDRALRLHRPDPRHPDRDPGRGAHRL